jgi:CoA:oxalate CoA-transferase
MGGAIGDLVPAIFTAMSVIAAILFREKTGKGQMIDCAQADIMLSINSSVVLHSLTGLAFWEMREKFPMAWNLGGHIRVEDGWIAVAGHRPRARDNLKKLLGKDEVTRKDLEELVSGMTMDEAVKTLVEIGMATGPVYSAGDTIKDPHYIARDMFVEIDHPKAGKIVAPNFPVKFSETTTEISSPAPLLGQHTIEVLMNLLDYSEVQIEQLEKGGVVVVQHIN